MSELPETTEQAVESLLTSESFKKNYYALLSEVDNLYRGVFDAAEADSVAALALITQAALVREIGNAETKARSLKRDIDFAKAEAYMNFKSQKTDDGKKLTENALSAMINKDDEVHRLYDEQNKAEREAKEFSNILAITRDAHIMFRSLSKKGT
jgi:hypothetical protein